MLLICVLLSTAGSPSGLSCDSPAILKACQDWGFSSKQDNGCQAYAKG